ncbi:hypothetical protein R6Q57_018808 [Mikania cordata]
MAFYFKKVIAMLKHYQSFNDIKPASTLPPLLETMAFAKPTLTLTLILVSANIIYVTCKNTHSAPKPTPVGIKGTVPGQKADVANMVAKQMQAIEKKINEFNASLKKRTNKHKPSSRSRECISECDEVFGAAIDDIKKTLDSLKSLNLVKANFDVSAVATNVDTCNDCFNEMVKGGDPEVKKFGDWVQKLTGDALAALQKAA